VLHLIFVRDVTLDEDRIATAATDLVDTPCPQIVVPIDEYNLRALARKDLGNALADSSSRACDNANFIFQLVINGRPPGFLALSCCDGSKAYPYRTCKASIHPKNGSGEEKPRLIATFARAPRCSRNQWALVRTYENRRRGPGANPLLRK
jgi:hypothetical protein